MSDDARPDLAAVHELEILVRHLADELAGFRRRALTAESRLRELEGKEGRPAADSQRALASRCAVLERENSALTGQLERAAARARQMLDRVRFIRQQTQGNIVSER